MRIARNSSKQLLLAGRALLLPHLPGGEQADDLLGLLATLAGRPPQQTAKPQSPAGAKGSGKAKKIIQPADAGPLHYRRGAICMDLNGHRLRVYRGMQGRVEKALATFDGSHAKVVWRSQQPQAVC